MSPRTRLLLICAAVAVAAAAITGGAVYLLRSPAAPPVVAVATSGPAFETQVECIAVSRAYDLWIRDQDLMAGLPAASPLTLEFEVKQLRDGAAAFADATIGYPDRAAAHLAVLVAGYRVEVGMIHLEVTATGKMSEARYLKAVDAWAAVKKGYQEFEASTCR